MTDLFLNMIFYGRKLIFSLACFQLPAFFTDSFEQCKNSVEEVGGGQQYKNGNVYGLMANVKF